jgi:hypothetical protein
MELVIFSISSCGSPLPSQECADEFLKSLVPPPPPRLCLFSGMLGENTLLGYRVIHGFWNETEHLVSDRNSRSVKKCLIIKVAKRFWI